MVLWGRGIDKTQVMHGKAFGPCQRGFALDKAVY